MGTDMVGWSEATPGAGGYIAVGGGENHYALGSNADSLKVKNNIQLLPSLWYLTCSSGSYCYLYQQSLKPYYYFTRGVSWDADASMSVWLYGDQARTNHCGAPLPLYAAEDLRVYSVNASDENTLIGAWLSNQLHSKNELDRRRPTDQMRYTVDQTVTANTWTSGTMVAAESLRRGTYAVIGMDVGAYDAGADHMAALARLVFKGQAAKAWRPGVLCRPLIGDKTCMGSVRGYSEFYHFPLDPTMSFEYDQTPDLEVLSPLAYDDFEVNLLLQKL